MDLDTGEVDVLYEESDGQRLSGPNDIVFDADGNMWFSDTGKFLADRRHHGRIHWATPDGGDIRTAMGRVDAPNGIGLSPDGGTLYFAETLSGRLYRRAIVGEGTLEHDRDHDPATLVCGLPGVQLFDSLAVAADGSVCVGTLIEGVITLRRCRRPARRAVHAARRAGRPHALEPLLRRPRPPHGLHHPLGDRTPRRLHVADPRPGPGVRSAGVPAEPVVPAHLADRQELFAARGYFEEVDHPLVGRKRYPSLPFRLASHTGPWFTRPAPLLGKHNDEVLAELGFDADGLARLRDEQVIGGVPLGL